MKKITLFFSLFAVGVTAVSFTACSQKKMHVDLGELKTLEDSAAYVLGITQGLGVKEQGIELNSEIFARAFQQGYTGDTTGMMTQAQMEDVMQKYQNRMMEKQAEAAKQESVPYRQAAEKFLAANKSAKGVVTTASGLQYRVIKQGSGITPANPDDRVRIQYSLSLLDKDGKVGTPIENTFERKGEPVIFAMNGLIPGMAEGLKLMNAGSEYEFWIHPDLGYGDQGGMGLPGGSMLVFKVEMVEVLPSKTK